ncbi:MAG: right-handed parallel beta-helix repeat-containing protein, partial [Planctomycetales bacterium]
MAEFQSRTIAACLLLLAMGWNARGENAIGVQGKIGCDDNPRRVSRLQITKPGVYENYLVDSQGATGNRVKITADNVTLRNCEIRNAAGNGVGVFGKNIVIENCKIHHLLNSTFDKQHDAHGITGRWHNVTIRNCEIFYVSGDCIQFDPDRKSAGKLLIENCTLWTGPLPADAGGFKKGERPGENAFDSKTPAQGERCQLTVRNCLMHGWKQPGQISLMAAMNLKENV